MWALVDRLGSALGVPALSPVVPLVVGSEQVSTPVNSVQLQHGSLVMRMHAGQAAVPSDEKHNRNAQRYPHCLSSIGS